MVAAGASVEEAQAATALPPREALPAPVMEQPVKVDAAAPASPKANGKRRQATTK
jgi:hypothetical protein